MNRLEVELVDYALVIRVDGRELWEIIREIELPTAAAHGQPDLAGNYAFLELSTVRAPSLHLLGEAANPMLEANGKVSLMECGCGIEGCWPLYMRITVTDETVIWSDPQQPHRKTWVYPEGWRLVFDRRQYWEALSRLKYA